MTDAQTPGNPAGKSPGKTKTAAAPGATAPASRLFNRRTAPAFALPVLALAFVALVALSAWGLRGARIDLTENRLYTLSAGTQRILDTIKEPVKLELFYSEKASRELPQFRVYAQRVQELLEEVTARSHGKVTLVVTDPEPFSEAEDRAAAHGLQGVPLGASGGTLYFGLVGTNSTDGETTMPFIQPDKETFLEYDLAKLISTLAIDKKPVVALLSDLPTGPSLDPLTNRPRPAWVLDRQLAELFELRRLQPGPTSIGDDVDLLMLVHPKQLSEDTQYAIDQFVLRGGRLLVFVDPLAESDPGINQVDLSGTSTPVSSDLPRLFAAWGVQYDPSRVVLDLRNALNVQPDPNAPPVRHLAILGLHKDVMNSKDVVTSGLETVNLSSAGALSLREGSPLKMEALLQSSRSWKFSDADSVRAAANNPGVLADGFKADSDDVRVLAARLTGPLKTAFPERNGPKHLAASQRNANLIIVADTDLLSDRLWVSVQEFLGREVYNPFANNADFAYNAVDNLVGNADLIAVRTRTNANRPFERVDVIRRAAEQRYLAKEKQLQQQLDELEQKLTQLQPAGKAGGAAPALTASQQRELQQFQAKKLSTRRELRDVQHQLNADIQELGSRLKLINILGMPVLVVLFALAVVVRRRWRRAAR